MEKEFNQQLFESTFNRHKLLLNEKLKKGNSALKESLLKERSDKEFWKVVKWCQDFLHCRVEKVSQGIRILPPLDKVVNKDVAKRPWISHPEDKGVFDFIRYLAKCFGFSKNDIEMGVRNNTAPVKSMQGQLAENESENVYTYHINLNERGSFSADVRDASGKTVYEIKAGNELSPDETSIFEDGYMKNPDDIKGLEVYLKELNVIPSDATIKKESNEHCMDENVKVVHSVSKPVKDSSGEWVVKWMTNGKRDEKKTYYTNSVEDAQKTAAKMSADAKKLNGGVMETATPTQSPQYKVIIQPLDGIFITTFSVSDSPTQPKEAQALAYYNKEREKRGLPALTVLPTTTQFFLR
jgi:hypothetical protein